MANDAALLPLSFLKRTLIFGLSPLALCSAAIAASLVAYDGDRLTAAVIATFLLIVSMTVAVFVTLLAKPALIRSPRFSALLVMFTSATYTGLVALTLGFGWSLVRVLHAQHGHYVLGGAMAVVFAAGVLALLASFSRLAFGLYPAHAVILALQSAFILALAGLEGSPMFALRLALPSVLILALVFLSIPRHVPQAPRPLLDPPTPP